MLPPKFETKRQARHRRAAKIRRLEADATSASLVLADKLSRCSVLHRCGSGACDVCLRLRRKRLIEQAEPYFAACSEVRTVSATVKWGIAEIGDLDTVDLTKNVANYQRGLQRVLSAGAILLGGVDVSLNTFDNLDPHWCVHFYFVVGDPGGVVSWKALRAYAKRHAPKADSSRVFRGVRISKPVPPEELTKVLGYSFKSVFSWRSGYWGTSEKTNRPRRNGRKLPLPSGYRVELALFLDKYRIIDRLLLIGVRRNGDDADFTLGPSGTSVVTAATPVRRRLRRGPR